MTVEGTAEWRKFSDTYTADFRRRRASQWTVLALAVAVIFLVRSSLGVSGKTLALLLGWNGGRLSSLVMTGFWVYGFAALVGGLLVDLFDRQSGKFGMVIGLAGTAVFTAAMLLIAGSNGATGFVLAATAAGTTAYYLCWTFWYLNSVFQALAVLSAIKAIASWVHFTERGIFAATFLSTIRGALFLLFSFSGLLVRVASWRWNFWFPVAAAVLVIPLVLRMKERPEDCGFSKIESPADRDNMPQKREQKALWIARKVFGNPTMLLLALSQLCLGFLIVGYDGWLGRNLTEAHRLPISSPIFQNGSFVGTIVIILGALLGGAISDWVLASRRIAVTVFAYCLQVLCLISIAQSIQLSWVLIAYLLILFSIAVVQTMIVYSASVDIASRNATGLGVGLLDGAQFMGGGLVATLMPYFLERRGWSGWTQSMAVTAAIAAILTATAWWIHDFKDVQKRRQK